MIFFAKILVFVSFKHRGITWWYFSENWCFWWRHPTSRDVIRVTRRKCFFQKMFLTILGKVEEFGSQFCSLLKVINNDTELWALWTPQSRCYPDYQWVWFKDALMSTNELIQLKIWMVKNFHSRNKIHNLGPRADDFHFSTYIAYSYLKSLHPGGDH